MEMFLLFSVITKLFPVATICQILKAKMHPIRFRLGLCTRPHWGAYSAPQSPDPLAAFEGSTSKGEGKRREGTGREVIVGKERERKGGKERGAVQFFASGRRRHSYATAKT